MMEFRKWIDRSTSNVDCFRMRRPGFVLAPLCNSEYTESQAWGSGAAGGSQGQPSASSQAL